MDSANITSGGAWYKSIGEGIFKSELLETKGGKVEYFLARNGDDSKPVVMASHGGLGGVDQARLMLEWVPLERYHLLCLSRPGYLLTPLESGRSMYEQADLFAALLDKLGIPKVGLVAASAGGPPAFSFARRHPDRLWGLLAIDCVSMHYEIPESAGPTAQFFLVTRFGQAMMQLIARIYPGWTARNILKPTGYFSKQELRRQAEFVLNDPDSRKYLGGFVGSMKNYHMRMAGTNNDLMVCGQLDKMELSGIRTPTLVVHGTRDADVRFPHGVYTRETIPGASRYWMEGGSHLGFWLDMKAKQAQQFALDFLDANCVNQDDKSSCRSGK